MISVRGKGISVQRNHLSLCKFSWEDKENVVVFHFFLLCCLFWFLIIDYDVWAAKYFSVLGSEVVLCWLGVEEVHLQNDSNWPF